MTHLERSVRLVRIGRNQVVRIPRDLELPGTEATVRKEGDTLKSLKPLRESLPSIWDRPAGPVDL